MSNPGDYYRLKRKRAKATKEQLELNQFMLDMAKGVVAKFEAKKVELEQELDRHRYVGD